MSGAVTPCRALVAGFGLPGLRDLDFGRKIIEYLQQLSWPDGVVVEDLSLAAPLVLHRLQELRPAKLVILVAVQRDVDPPATVRRCRLDLSLSDPAQIHRSIQASLTDMVGFEHTMAAVRHWGELPEDTVVIEVEPADMSVGLGFSEELAACVDAILDMVREELADVADGAGFELALDPDALSTDGPHAAVGGPVAESVTEPEREPSEALAELQGYATDYKEARRESQPAPPLVDGLALEISGVALAGRVRPWGVNIDSGGDWFDAVPLGAGGFAMVVGDLDGRGFQMAAAMSDLRAAVRAYAVLEGDSPGRLLCDLDRLAEATGQGRQARLVYLWFQPATGELRFSNAGGCPLLVLCDGAPGGRFLDTARSAPVGVLVGAGRPQETMHLALGSTVILFTHGLVESRATSRGEGLERLRRAAVDGPDELDALCDHILALCTTDIRRDDDICLVGLRRMNGGGPDTAPPLRRAR